MSVTLLHSEIAILVLTKCANRGVVPTSRLTSIHEREFLPTWQPHLPLYKRYLDESSYFGIQPRTMSRLTRQLEPRNRKAVESSEARPGAGGKPRATLITAVTPTSVNPAAARPR
ncbi:hypothetical protein THAOC_10266, partial [Thalassiosira oceanica]